MALPQLTDEQRKQALEKAAAARHARAELREQIKKGEKSLESVLNSDDPIASRMKVSTLLQSMLYFHFVMIIYAFSSNKFRRWRRGLPPLLAYLTLV